LLTASQSLAQTAERPDTYIHGYSYFVGLSLTPTMDFSASVGQQFAVVKGGDLDTTLRRQSIIGAASLDHDLGRGRSQRFALGRSVAESFDGGVDVTDQLSYRYGWSGLWLPGSFSSDYLIVDPLARPDSGYRNWNNSVQVRMQLTQIIPLSLSASYAMRFNETSGRAAVFDDDPEIRNDYQTLSLVARTGFRITRTINFTAYVQHVQRTADNPQLEYTRDTVGMQLTWGYQF